MRWPRGRRDVPQETPPRLEPVVLAVTSPLTRETAIDLGRRLERVTPKAPVVIDLTAIPSFDSDGAAELLHLQEVQRDRDVSIVGLRQATARLVGSFADVPAPRLEGGWVRRRLRNLDVVQPRDEATVDVNGLEEALGEALDGDSAIVVVDLRGVLRLDPATVDVIAFASSKAALRGQEMLVVNVAAGTAELLRSAGLSATTYVAPEPTA